MAKEQVLICECGYPGHQLIFASDPDEPETVYIDVKITHVTFWKRLKWLLGLTSSCGDYDQVITTRTKLRDIINDI